MEYDRTIITLGAFYMSSKKMKTTFRSDISERLMHTRILLSHTYCREDTQCAVWLGKLDKSGYGICSFNGKSKRIHRMIMMLIGKDISGKKVGHCCGNKACCNPDHLMFISASAPIANDTPKKIVPLYARGRLRISSARVREARSSLRS